MSWLDGLAHRIRTVLRPADYERELREEMELHQQLDAAQQADPSQARRRFGNRTYYLEEARRMTWLAPLDVLRQDLGFAMRSIRRYPGHTATVVVTLALGVGLNGAAFSVLDRLYLRPPAGVAHPDGIRRIWIERDRMAGESHQAMSYPMVRTVARAAGDTTRVAAVRTYTTRFGDKRRSPKVSLHYTTANYFQLLGVRPALGRFYTVEEARPNSGAAVVVVSDHFWRRHMAADPGIVGKLITLETKRFTVIGITPPSFAGIDVAAADMWGPIGTIPQDAWLKGGIFESHRMHVFRAFARFVAPEDWMAFERRATPLLRIQSREQWPQNPDTLMRALTGSIVEARGPAKAGTELAISARLSGVATIVLLIAAANVINLLLARAVRRRREFAVRLAVVSEDVVHRAAAK